MYAKGEGVQQNDAEALRLLRLAADQGHADAQTHLALGTTRDTACHRITVRL